MKLVRTMPLKITGGGAKVQGLADMWVWLREMTLESNVYNGYSFVFATEMYYFSCGQWKSQRKHVWITKLCKTFLWIHG